ncbi:MAG: TonB-dependent receptor [Bacteroidales bacterium]|nr:TonB-dependent receptor [Bacteroidales bacterium]
MKKLFSILLILIPSVLFAQTYTISGYIKDADTGEELIAASVYVPGTTYGVISNNYGFYSLSVPKGTHIFEVSYLGYTTYSEKIVVEKDITKNVYLETFAQVTEKVVVTAQARDQNIKSTEMGVQTLDMHEIKSVPVLFGENDVLKTLQLMPGVKSGGEGSGGIFVRGGGADQNLILLDEAPVYNASHMLGFFSVFNGDAIKDVKLYKGSMPAKYGGRLSSVVDIKMKEGNNQSYEASGGIGTISSRITVEGPIVKDTSSFMISARRTYADMLLLFSKDTNFRDTKLYFYDLNLKTNYIFNEKNRLFISGYFGRDVFAFQDIFGTDWGNATGTVRWVHLLSPKLFMNSTLIFSNFENIITVGDDSGQFELSSGITDFQLKEDFQWYANNSNSVSFGFNTIHHTFIPGDLKSSIEGISVSMDNKYALESGLYASNEQKVSDYITLNYGLRFSLFTIIGPGTTYTYDNNHERIDSAVYKKREIIENYPSLEPRLGATFILNSRSSIKMSYTLNNQYVHLIQSSTSSLPTDYWIPSSALTPPQKCAQYSVGYFRNFAENKYESSAEIYYKDLESQIDYESGTNIFLEPDLESYLLFGKGRAYGLELFAKKNQGTFTGWISYTWSRTEKQFEELNKARWFPTRYDRKHDISIVGMYDISKNVQVSATWVFATGDAVTMPSGKYILDGKRVNYYTDRNGYRMPNYHRLDLGCTVIAKKTDRYESSFNFSIYNTYNRKNAYMIYFERVHPDNVDELQAVKVTLFPILPAITWNFRF